MKGFAFSVVAALSASAVAFVPAARAFAQMDAPAPVAPDATAPAPQPMVPAATPPAGGPAPDATTPTAPVGTSPAPTPVVPEEEVVPAPGFGIPSNSAGGNGHEMVEDQEEVVTGSHIRRKDLTTPAPVIVISRAQIQQSGIATVSDYLQTIAQQAGGTNSAMNNPGDGASTINLRGLGVDRTLVLINGRRVVGYASNSAGYSGVVDLNVIPLAMVDRIEILLDGASGVYGSDAIGGVVNIITLKNYNGADLTTYQGLAERGDGYVSDYEGTIGTSSDKGNISLGLQYYRQNAVSAGNRSFSAYALSDNFQTGQVSRLGSVNIPNTSFVAPCAPGVGTPLFQQLCNTPSATGLYKGNGQGGFNAFNVPNDYYNYQPANFNQTPAERFTAFSSGNYHITDNTRVYYEALLASRQSEQQLAPEPLATGSLAPFAGAPPTGINLSANSIYNPFGVDLGNVFRRMTEQGDRTVNQQYWTGRLVAGIDGTIPELHSWAWDISLNYGRSTATTVSTGYANTANVSNALGPSMVINGVPTCVTQAGKASTAIPGCVPLNLLGGAGSVTPAMLNYIGFTGADNAMEQMFEQQANINGELFKLWSSAPVSLAIGQAYRRVYGFDQPDPVTVAQLSTGNNSQPSAGGYYVNELYAEANIPIIDKVPGVYALEGTAAVRYSNYNTFGDTTNYKFGLRWSIFKDLTIRGTATSGFRAPSVSELYSGQTQSFLTATDPCKILNGSSPATLVAECKREGVGPSGTNDPRSQLPDVVGGNTLLQPERSNAYTVGAVFEPRWVKNLSLTVDYYNVGITNAIETLGINEIFSECYNSAPAAGTDHPAVCNGIHRGAGSLISSVLDLYSNLAQGGDETDGMDFGLNYRLPTPAGGFQLGADVTWLHRWDQTLADGTVVHALNTYDEGYVLPEWKFTAGLSWGLGHFGAAIFERFFSSSHECGDSSGLSGSDGACYQLAQNSASLGIPPASLIHQVPAYSVTNILVSANMNTMLGKTQLQLGINNLFDTPPPTIYDAAQPQSDPSAYDFLGRYFYLMLSQKFL